MILGESVATRTLGGRVLVVYSLTAFLKEMDRAKSVSWNLEFRLEREVSPKGAAVSRE